MSYPKPGKGTDWTVAKTDKPGTECNLGCEQSKPSEWPGVETFITDVSVKCDPDTGKEWLTKTVLKYDETCFDWDESCEGIYELPKIYKPSAEGDEAEPLPDFNGVIEATSTDGEVIEVIGGQPVPADLAGYFICINGELCYTPAPVPVKPEVQVGGDAPEADSGVSIWIDNGVSKYPTDAGWVQTNPYGK